MNGTMNLIQQLTTELQAEIARGDALEAENVALKGQVHALIQTMKDVHKSYMQSLPGGLETQQYRNLRTSTSMEIKRILSDNLDVFPNL